MRRISAYVLRDAALLFTSVTGVAMLAWVAYLLSGEMFGFLGYDGIVWHLGQNNPQVPMYGGTYYYFPVAFVAISIVASAPLYVFGGRLKMDESHRSHLVIIGLTVPITFLVLAGVATVLSIAGVYEAIFTSHGPPLAHRGITIMARRLWIGPIALVLTSIAVAVKLCTTESNPTFTLIRAFRTSLFVALGAIVVLAMILLSFDVAYVSRYAADTAKPLASGAFIWAVICCALLSIRSTEPGTLHRIGYCDKCEYDLRGTIAAGRNACPECGTPMTDKSFADVQSRIHR